MELGLNEILSCSIEDNITHEILNKDIDLREYSIQTDNKLKEVEKESIKDYIKESENIANLHQQISSYDKILENMEKMLLCFQFDLGSISNEIQNIQKQSVAMNIKLKNRQNIIKKIEKYMDEIIVSEETIRIILENPVTDANFINELHILDSKINFVKSQQYKDARSCQDIQGVLEKLKMKVVSKIKNFFLEKISIFRKPMTNYHIPQGILLRHQFFYKFLLSHAIDIAKEIYQHYIDTMSKVYFSYFKMYCNLLLKLQNDDVPLKDDVLGSEGIVKKNIFSSKPAINRMAIFTIGKRAELLTSEQLEKPIIVPHATDQQELFRSMQYAVADNGCREYHFLMEFFTDKDVRLQEQFDFVFTKSLSFIIKLIETYTADSFDALALLTCAYICHLYQLLCHRRAVSVLDTFWNNLLKLFYPRFEYVFQLHIQSLHICDVHRLNIRDIRPHYISRQYAEFTSALYMIYNRYPSGQEQVESLSFNLLMEMEGLLNKMASTFVGYKSQLAFLINNYDVIIGIMAEQIKQECRECDCLKEHINHFINEYVEEILSPNFGFLIQFVKTNENEVLSYKDKDKIQNLIHIFSLNWKKCLNDIDKEIKMSFPNFRNGNNILQTTLTQFIHYYHQFHKLLSKNNVLVSSELINIHQLMVEIKKYKPSF